MDVIATYDTEVPVESQFTSDFLGDLFTEYLPQFLNWVSTPDEDNSADDNWSPKWYQISEPLAEIKRLFDTGGLDELAIEGFTEADTREEIEMFRNELLDAKNHTERFFLSTF